MSNENSTTVDRPVREYYVNVTFKIPHSMLGRLTKKSIATKQVELVAADWDRVREANTSANRQSEERAESDSANGCKKN